MCTYIWQIQLLAEPSITPILGTSKTTSTYKCTSIHKIHTHTTRIGIKPETSKILLTEPPMNPLANRKKMVSTMLEKYGFESVCVAIQAVLSLCAHGMFMFKSYIYVHNVCVLIAKFVCMFNSKSNVCVKMCVCDCVSL